MILRRLFENFKASQINNKASQRRWDVFLAKSLFAGHPLLLILNWTSVQSPSQDLEDQLKALKESQDHLQSSLTEAETKVGQLNENLTQADSAKEELEQILKKEITDANIRMLSEWS